MLHFVKRELETLLLVQLSLLLLYDTTHMKHAQCPSLLTCHDASPKHRQEVRLVICGFDIPTHSDISALHIITCSVVNISMYLISEGIRN